MSAKTASKYVPDDETPAPAANAPVAPAPAWIDSTDPKRRQIAQVALWLLWLYVAALWVLALDQWFNWGIFGPKIAPIP